MEIFSQIRAHCWLICLADRGIAARFTAQLSKLSEGVKTAIEYKWGLNPLTSFASLQSFDLHLHSGAKSIILFFRRVFRIFFFCTFVFLTCWMCVIAAWLLPAKCEHSVPSSDGNGIFAAVNHSYSYNYYCCCYFWNISGSYITTAGSAQKM